MTPALVAHTPRGDELPNRARVVAGYRVEIRAEEDVVLDRLRGPGHQLMTSILTSTLPSSVVRMGKTERRGGSDEPNTAGRHTSVLDRVFTHEESWRGAPLRLRWGHHVFNVLRVFELVAIDAYRRLIDWQRVRDSGTDVLHCFDAMASGESALTSFGMVLGSRLLGFSDDELVALDSDDRVENVAFRSVPETPTGFPEESATLLAARHESRLWEP